MYFVAVKLPAFRVSHWVLGHFAELLQQCFTISITRKLLEVLPYELINTLAHRISMTSCFLEDHVVYGQS